MSSKIVINYSTSRLIQIVFAGMLFFFTACAISEYRDPSGVNSGPIRAGVVIDTRTKQPIPGAYVLAVYNTTECKFPVGCATWCKKTLGMVTGADGVFSFPRESRYWPQIYAIKADYFRTNDPADLGRLKWDGKGESPESLDQNTYLKPQDPNMPKLQFSSGDLCVRADKKEDVVAQLEFLKIEKIEWQKYNKKVDAEVLFRSGIRMLESVPIQNFIQKKSN